LPSNRFIERPVAIISIETIELPLHAFPRTFGVAEGSLVGMESGLLAFVIRESIAWMTGNTSGTTCPERFLVYALDVVH
jgi:hypothetical protein